MPNIGPFSFPVMDGRLQVAAPRGRGERTTGSWSSRKPQETTLRTVESFTTFGAAWARAAVYRQTVGALAPIVDGNDQLCLRALLSDVRTRIRVEGDQAVLVTNWNVVPFLGYGDAGEALIYTPEPETVVNDPVTLEQPIAGEFAVMVGPLPFLTGTGDVQWPIIDSQRDAVMRYAKIMGIEDAVTPPSESQGRLDTTTQVVDDAEGFRLMFNCRLLVGSIVAVNLGGTVIPCAVLNVDCDWRDANNSPGGVSTFFRALWDLQPQTPKGGNVDARSFAIVQVAQSFGAWTNREHAICHNARQGLGGSLASLSWREPIGELAAGRKKQFLQPESLKGQWVRILLKLDERDTDPQPIWYGIVAGQKTTGGSGRKGTMVTFSAGGMLYGLSKLTWRRWYEKGQDIARAADPGEVLPFNELLNGDRNGAVDAISRIHDRQVARPEGGPKPQWTALQVVTSLLEGLAAQWQNQGVTYLVGGQTDALGFAVDMADLRGMDGMETMLAIMNYDFGLTFREIVDEEARTVTLEVRTLTKDPVTIPGLGILPANDEQFAPDLSENKVTEWDWDEDEAEQYDVIYVEGENHQTSVTMRYDDTNGETGAPLLGATLVKGWTAAEETEWDAATFEVKNSPKLIHVWRRFVPAPTWKGEPIDPLPPVNNALQMNRVQNGDGFEDGELTALGNAVIPNPLNLRFTKDQSFSTRHDWEIDPYSEEPDNDAEPMQAMLHLLTNGTTYADESTKWDITIEQTTGAILVGRDAEDGNAIKLEIEDGIVTQGKDMLITLGLMHPIPWRVEWRRDPAQRPRNQDRVLLIKVPLMFRRIERGTIVGMVGADGIQKMTQRVDIARDAAIDQMNQVLELAKLFHVPCGGALTYTTRGEVNTLKEEGPGAFITTPKLRIDRRNTFEPDVDQIITAREWGLEIGNQFTRVSTERLFPRVDRVALTGDMIQQLADIPVRDLFDFAYDMEQGR